MINKGQNGNGFDVESLPIADLVNSIKRPSFINRRRCLNTVSASGIYS